MGVVGIKQEFGSILVLCSYALIAVCTITAQIQKQDKSPLS